MGEASTLVRKESIEADTGSSLSVEETLGSKIQPQNNTCRVSALFADISLPGGHDLVELPCITRRLRLGFTHTF